MFLLPARPPGEDLLHLLLHRCRAQVSTFLSPWSLIPNTLQHSAGVRLRGLAAASRHSLMTPATVRTLLALPPRCIHILDRAGTELRQLGPLPQPATQLVWAGAAGEALVAATSAALHLWAAAGEHEGPVLQAPPGTQFVQLAACRGSPLLAASTAAGEVGAAGSRVICAVHEAGRISRCSRMFASYPMPRPLGQRRCLCPCLIERD